MTFSTRRLPLPLFVCFVTASASLPYHVPKSRVGFFRSPQRTQPIFSLTKDKNESLNVTYQILLMLQSQCFGTQILITFLQVSLVFQYCTLVIFFNLKFCLFTLLYLFELLTCNFRLLQGLVLLSLNFFQTQNLLFQGCDVFLLLPKLFLD